MNAKVKLGEKCSACGACADVCKKKCIELQKNIKGEFHPVIDLDECIHCGMCERVCPHLNVCSSNAPLKCFAAYTDKARKRDDSASGGIARMLYENFLRMEGAYVVGVQFDTHYNPIFSITNDIEKIGLYQGSKYIQAEVGNLFSNIETLLKEQKKVLLIALPCQIEACKHFLSAKRIDVSQLFCVDILCHGVTPAQYWNEHLMWIKNKKKWEKILSVSFRSNKPLRNYHMFIEGQSSNGKMSIYDRISYEDYYFNGFLTGITLCETCYNCKYATERRVGDMTIGDFIGLGKDKPFEGNPINASMILLNNIKGEELFEKIKPEILYFERDFGEAVQSGLSLQSPGVRGEGRDVFLDNYSEGMFYSAMKCAKGKELLKKRLRYSPIRIVKRVLYSVGYRKRLYNKDDV